MQVYCPSCETACPDHADTCPECGHRLAPTAGQGVGQVDDLPKPVLTDADVERIAQAVYIGRRKRSELEPVGRFLGWIWCLGWLFGILVATGGGWMQANWSAAIVCAVLAWMGLWVALRR